MKILYIGTPINYQLWKKGKNPSHWVYGAAEMEQEGHNVIWAQEKTSLFNDLKLFYRNRPQMIFIPTFNFHAHILLLLFSFVKFINTPIYIFIHHTPNGGKFNWLLKLLLKRIHHAFFLSEKTMKETISLGFIKCDKASVPGWGPDMNFYNRIEKKAGDYFVSTGKEMRDFDTLIKAFQLSGAPLHIITCHNHAGTNFDSLPEKCKDIPNIKVTLTANSGNVYPLMLNEMAHSKAIVCPLIKDKLNYCVGLSTITDAEGLNKPLIITENPYHSSERTNNFYRVNSVEDWIKAIDELQKNVPIACSNYSMAKCYRNMKAIMFE